MNKHFLLYIFLLLVGAGKINAQLFEQNFSSSTTVASYVSATPSNGQFNAISSTGNSNVSIITTGSNQLRIERLTSGSAIYSRTTDFSPEPSAIIYKFDLTVSGSTGAQTTAAVWQVGAGFGTTNSAEAISLVHSRIGLNLTANSGEFSLRNIGGSTSSATFTGTQTITWVINNSGSTLTYRAPDGSNESVVNDAADVWVGTTKVFNDIAATTATQPLTDIKFAFTAGSAVVDIDNILIARIPAIPTAMAATNVTANTFTANWTPVTGVTGYRIDVATDAGFTNILGSYDNLYVAGQATNSLIITGLAGSTQYYYRVRSASQYNLGEFASGNSSTENLTTQTALQTITTDSILGAPFCVTVIDGALLDVDFTYSPGIDFQGSTFTAQLSDSSGSFASPIIIGTVASNASGAQTINAEIPAGTITGTGYRIRVVSDTPSLIGSENGSDFGIYLADVNVTPAGAQTIAVSSNGTLLTANEASTPVGTEWYAGTVSGGPYTTFLDFGSTYIPNFSTPGVYYVVAESEFDCGIIISNEIEITVTAGGAAVINVTGTPLIDFTAYTDCPSPSQSFNVGGTSLTDDIILNAPSNFEISTDDIVWLNNLTLLETGGTVPATVIYVRYNPSTSGTHSGNITINSTGAAQETVPVSGSTSESVVINKYNVTTDEVELLVVEDNLNLQGLIIKDFSNNMNDDNGGTFEFSNNALWNSVPAGTLIILRNDNSAADTDATDYTLDIGLQNATYFTSLGGTWDLENTDMVMIKEAGSGSSGVMNNVHVLAAGTAGTYFTTADEPKLISNTAASAANPFVYAITPNSEICDYIGTAAGVTSGLVFGQANNSTNMSFICILRLFPQPTITVSGPVEFCIGDSVVLDAGPGFDSYLWSNNDTTQTIIVSSTGTFTVTVGDMAGCTAMSTNTINVTVNPLPTVTLSAFAAVCNNDPQFALTGGSPNGGTYSGPGVSAGNFNPMTAGVGTHTITYTYTDPNGCTNFATENITVNSCGTTVPTIQLQAPYCPYTMNAILDYVYAQQVAGVSNYQYYIEEVGSANPFTATYNRNSGSNILSLMWIKGIQFNTTYAVQVRAFVNGQWGTFGPACNVTTPSNLPTPAIDPAFCNITMTNINDIMTVTPVWQATNYHYEITNVTAGSVMNYHRGSGSNAFSLGWVKGILYNTLYSVRVRANINGDWTSFSSPCLITTPGIPSTQIAAPHCNATLPALNTVISANLVPHADNYRYTITDSLGFTAVYHRGSASNLFNLSWVPGVQTNTTYYVTVQAMQGASVGPMGTACAITTPSMARFISAIPEEEKLTFSIYPNPNNGERFTINLENIKDNSPIKIDIYDLSGKLVWDNLYTTNSPSITVELGNSLSNGIYTISILSNDEIQFQKLVIQD